MSISLPKRLVVPARRDGAPDNPSELESILHDTPLLESLHGILTSAGVPNASDTPAQPYVVGVTAGLYDEGASSLAIGLAVSLAYAQKAQVAIVDCDAGWPSLHRRLSIPPAPGLTDVVGGRSTIHTALRQTRLPNLVALAAGRRTPRRIEESIAQRDCLIHFARESNVHYIVLDLPPANVDVGTPVLASTADALLLVVRSGVTRRAEVTSTLTRLNQCKLAGIVVNDARPPLPSWLGRLTTLLRGEG